MNTTTNANNTDLYNCILETKDKLLDLYFYLLFQCNHTDLNDLLRSHNIKGKQNEKKSDKVRLVVKAQTYNELNEDHLEAYIYKYESLMNGKPPKLSKPLKNKVMSKINQITEPLFERYNPL